MDYPRGSDPYTARQYLLHHMYSPLISVESSPNADIMMRSILNDDDISLLSILKPYGNNVKYAMKNQVFKVTNNQLITKNYPSFPIRFEPSLPDLLSINNTDSGHNNSNPPSTTATKLHQLFSISSLELLLKKIVNLPHVDHHDDIYLQFFNKIITSNLITPFETFNHPVAQIFIINYNDDPIEYLRNKIVAFRNFNFPNYFQITDLLVHVFVLYDKTITNDDEITAFQHQITKTLSISSSCIPIIDIEDNDPSISSDHKVQVLKNENSTIDEEIQRVSLDNGKPFNKYFEIPANIDYQFRLKIYEFIATFLIPHMEKHIRIWDDQILSPRRSIASRFFSVSRKLFNNNNNQGNNESSSSSFNYHDNYYYKSSPEQIIRKLADWSLILKDFKYSYSVYDFIKKDYTNDKAWIYVASTQEMCMISLLLVQTQLPNPLSQQSTIPDKNTLRKIRHDIVEPSLDNISYTYKSRLNLKTYSIRTHLVVIELLLCMCTTYNMSWWWQDLIEKYLIKIINEFDHHLIASNQDLQIIKAILLERLGYSFGKYQSIDKFIDFDQLQQRQLLEATKSESDELGDKSEGDKSEGDKSKPDHEQGYYINHNKLKPNINANNFGFNRYRKSSLWYLLSIKEWINLHHYKHVEFLLSNIERTYDINSNDNWYDKDDLLLGIIKYKINEG